MKSGKIISNFVIAVQKLLAKKNSEETLNDNLNCNFNESDLKVLKELLEVQNKLKQAYTVFNNQTDIDLIESSIYDIEALETRYNYLIKEARKRKIKATFGAC